MATVKNILFFLAVIPAVPLAHSKQALWGTNVFPDDLQGLFPEARRRLSSWKKGVHKHAESVVEPKNYEICETPECKIIGEEFRGSMNKSVDPCEDFYEFMCGGWKAEDKIPGYLVKWSRLMIFQTTVEHRIKAVLETEPEPSDILPLRQAKKWYRSCMDSENLDRRGLNPIESILMQIGGWPIAMDEEEWDAEAHTWQAVEREYARLTGSYALFAIDAMRHTNESDDGNISLDAPEIPLAEQLPLKYRNYSGNDYETYVRLVERAVDLFVQHNRANVSKDKIRKDAEDMVEFEKEIYMLKGESWNYDKMPLDEFIEWYESNITEISPEPSSAIIDWKTILQDLFEIVNIKVKPSSVIILRTNDYIVGIGELLRKTPTRTIVNYIHWKFVSDMMPYTIDRVRQELFEFVRAEFGAKERPPRWKECVDDMKMTDVAAHAFVSKFYPESTETAALQMVKNIKVGLEKNIDNSNWMDEESKKLTKDKLNSMKVFLGFPDWYKNTTAVINHYKGLAIGTEYFDNTLSYIRYTRKKELKQFALIYEDEEDDPWSIDPITVNALYNPYENIVNVPAADFQPPLFTKGLPDQVNYGITGVIVGHELSHGFDDSGITMGKNGGETKLADQMLKAYYQRAECFLDQFQEYYGETKAPLESGEETAANWMEAMSDFSRLSRGLITRGENIADTTGIQAVFEAYRKIDKPGGHARLPGLEEFTDDQLFFLSFGATWCEVSTRKLEQKREEGIDPHSPPRYRVMGAVSNTEAFAKAFNCPKGSGMNPDHKCSVWSKPGAVPKVDKDCNKKRNNRRWGGGWGH